MGRLLVFLLLAGVFAAIIFQVGLDPRVAGLFAGSSFIVVGFLGVFFNGRALAGGGGYRALAKGMLAGGLAFSVLHLAGIAIPMLVFRILNWSEPFSKVSVWGLAGPEFHAYSTRLYTVWFFWTLLTWWLLRRPARLGA